MHRYNSPDFLLFYGRLLQFQLQLPGHRLVLAVLDKYDSLSGAAEWARASLEAHANDLREWTYSIQELEKAKTHEDLWNAAQLQLVSFGDDTLVDYDIC